MKPEEAATLVGFLKGAFPSMTPEQMDVYEASLLSEDATLASKAILAGIREWTYTPKYAEIIERMRLVARIEGKPALPEPPDRSVPPPFWVKRWIVARYVTRPPDKRIFREEEEGHPEGYVPAEGWMPDDAYVEEAKALTPEQVTRAMRSSLGVGKP
jgi:hypothetical protein